MKRCPELSLRQALGRWRDVDEFYFFRRFMDDMRIASANNAPTLLRSKNKSKATIFLKQLSSIFIFCRTLFRSLFLPRGKSLVFNHSKRCRNGEIGSRPLYISSYFSKTQFLIVEDDDSDPCRRLGFKVLSGRFINRGAELISGGLAKYLQWHYGILDRDIVTFFVRRKIWHLIFLVIRPSQILTFVWYGKESMIAAAKSLNIPVIDIQHGIVYTSHPFYRINEVPGKGTNLLPDRCLVYGEYWKQKLIESGWRPEQVEVAGYFLDVGVGKTQSIKRPYILYTSQPHTHAEIRSHINAIVNLVEQKGWRIVISLHPADLRNSFSDLTEKGVIVSDIDTYDMMRDCEVHVSVSSTLLWEAMVFGKPSYILEFGREATDLLSDLVSFGFGKTLDGTAFPEPFVIPATPSIDFFFRKRISLPTMRN